MAGAATQKLNMNETRVPSEMIGKKSRYFAVYGKTMRASAVLTFGEIWTKSRMFGGKRTTCEDLRNSINISKPTAVRNLKELSKCECLKHGGQSEYTVKFKPESKGYLSVYQFLFDEKIVGCKLGKNDALFLANLIRHYLNQNRKKELFEGGAQHVASFLGVSKSTACEVIRRLLKAGLIYRNVRYEDGRGNEIVTEGCGSNQHRQTVYLVNKDILRYAAKIEAERKARLEKRKQAAAEKAAQAPKSEPTETCGDEEFIQSSKATKKPKKHREQAKSLTDQFKEAIEWARAEDNFFAACDEFFQGDGEYIALRERYEHEFFYRRERLLDIIEFARCRDVPPELAELAEIVANNENDEA